MKLLRVPLLSIVLLVGVACGPQTQTQTPPAPGGQARPVEHAEPATAGQPRPNRAPVRLERKHTGQATPTLIVNNQFPIGQHVFLDSKHLGSVASGARATFELSPGVHTVASADSADQDDNPVSITESFEAGFSYSYEIAPE